MDTMEKIAAAATIVGTVIAGFALLARLTRTYRREWEQIKPIFAWVSRFAFPFGMGGVAGLLTANPDYPILHNPFAIACILGVLLGLFLRIMQGVDSYNERHTRDER